MRVKEVGRVMGSRIKSRLDELEMTQAELCRKSGLSTGYVSDLINGNRGKRLSVVTASRLGKALKVSANFFYTEDSHMRHKER
jgi:transcriptional regulator with XRE-family HTH domain